MARSPSIVGRFSAARPRRRADAHSPRKASWPIGAVPIFEAPPILEAIESWHGRPGSAFLWNPARTEPKGAWKSNPEHFSAGWRRL